MSKTLFAVILVGAKLAALALAWQPVATADDCMGCPEPECFPGDCNPS